MSTTSYMNDFDMNTYHVHELHAILQQRHISEYIPHIYIRYIVFAKWSTKKNKKRRPPGTRGFEWLRIDV